MSEDTSDAEPRWDSTKDAGVNILQAQDAAAAAVAVAPRVSKEDIEAKIAAVHYINAGQASAYIEGRDWTGERTSIDLLTICVLVMQNGFTVVGESACASPENYDKELGEQIAYRKAFDEAWKLEGYLLREHLHQAPAS